MATIHSEFIITGSAELFLAPKNTPMPVLPTTPNGNIQLDAAWQTVGSTDAGLEFNYNPTFKNIMVDEVMSAIKTIKTAEEMMISASLAEATLKNLNLAINGATLSSSAATNSAAGYTKLTVGGSQQYTEYALLVIGPGPLVTENGQSYTTTRFLHGYRVYSTAKIKQAYKKDDKVMIPVEFTFLCDTSRAAGDQLAELYEKTASATS